MDKVVITDYTFDEINIEKDILESLGCEVVAQKTHTGEDDMIGLVRDADFVINQFAPITARVIDSMTRCRVISRYGIGFDSVDVDAAAGDVGRDEHTDAARAKPPKGLRAGRLRLVAVDRIRPDLGTLQASDHLVGAVFGAREDEGAPDGVVAKQ